MEEIEINGQKYILKEDIEKKYILKNKIEKYTKNPKIKEIDFCMNKSNTIAIGSVKLEGDWKVVKIDISYLEKAIKVHKSLEKENRGLSVALTNDNVFIIGNFDKEKQTIAGVFIAPRTEE